MSQKAVSDQLLGVGQRWCDMKSERVASHLYFNTTGRTIAVSIWATSKSNASPSIIVNGVTVGGFNLTNLSSGSGSAQLFAIIPPGHSYIAHVDIITWSELL
jgi:hypothetical protein